MLGYVVEFEEPEPLIAAAAQLREAGYKKTDAFTPFPVEGVFEALGHSDNWMPKIMLGAGISGAVLGFGFISYVVGVDYPLNIGGRPLLPIPLWIPVTFEITVLLAAFSGVIGLFMINRLPEPHHPLFDVEGFDKASSSRFFLGVEAADPRFSPEETRTFLEGLGGLRVAPVLEKEFVSEVGRENQA